MQEFNEDLEEKVPVRSRRWFLGGLGAVSVTALLASTGFFAYRFTSDELREWQVERLLNEWKIENEVSAAQQIGGHEIYWSEGFSHERLGHTTGLIYSGEVHSYITLFPLTIDIAMIGLLLTEDPEARKILGEYDVEKPSDLFRHDRNFYKSTVAHELEHADENAISYDLDQYTSKITEENIVGIEYGANLAQIAYSPEPRLALALDLNNHRTARKSSFKKIHDLLIGNLRERAGTSLVEVDDLSGLAEQLLDEHFMANYGVKYSTNRDVTALEEGFAFVDRIAAERVTRPTSYSA